MPDEFYMMFLTWLLVFARLVMVFVQAPIFGSHHIPKPILAGTAAVLAINIFPTVGRPDRMPYDFRDIAMMVLTQICVGLVIGFVSFLVMGTAQFGGEMLDIQMGLSVAASFDPSSHGAVNLLRRLHFYVAMMIYLIMNGHHQLVEAMYYSFKVVPLDHFTMSEALANDMIFVTGRLFVIGTQMAAPALGALFVTQCALGLLARVAPQMNVFMLSFPLNIAIGLFMLTVSLPLIIQLLTAQFEVNLDDMARAMHIMGGGR